MFLSNFIPRALEAVAQVDAVGEHGQGGGFEDEFLAVAVDVPGPGEGAFFEALCHQPVSGAVEVEDFDELARLVGEEEGRAAEWIEFEMVAHEHGEGVEAFAHVAWLDGDVDLEVAVEGEHGRGSGEVAQQGGEQADLAGIGGAGDGTAGQADFQGGAAGFRGDLGNEECLSVAAGCV